MKRGLIIGAGIIGVLAGMAFVMPAVAQYRHEGAMSHGEPWLFLLGSALTLAGCHSTRPTPLPAPEPQAAPAVPVQQSLSTDALFAFGKVQRLPPSRQANAA